MKITVLVKQPGKIARVTEVENSLEGFRSVVGDGLEEIPLDYDVLLSHIPGICAFCNDEGKINNMKPNFIIGNLFNGCYDVVCGPAVFAGVEDEDTVSLTEKQISMIKKAIKANEVIA